MFVITIFGSSQVAVGEADYERGVRLGAALAQAGYTVCNGGYGGMMEATARGAKEAGGKTLGVTTAQFQSQVNRWIDEEIKMAKWSERLFRLVEMGNAYVVCDGGTGTLVELFIVLEMLVKKMHTKPVVVLGSRIKKVVDGVRELPEVREASGLFFADSPEAVLTVLKGRR